jgi:hypothetical protein
MPRPLAELLANQKGGPIAFEGRAVRMHYEFDPIRHVVEFDVALEAASDRPQGVFLNAEGGQLEIEGQTMTKAVLWADTAPPAVLVRVVPRRPGPTTLSLWNVWRTGRGDERDYWTGDAGLAVESSGDGRIVIAASDGASPPNFDDLRVAIDFR